MKLTENQLRNVIREELKKIILENEKTEVALKIKTHILSISQLYNEAAKSYLFLDLGKLHREFIDKFKSSDQADPMAYVLASAKAWADLYASDADHSVRPPTPPNN
jgi:hypothetical protein